MRKRSLDRKNVIRDASFFSGSTYLSQAMFFIRGFLNARILGPGLYGLWSALNIILNYGSYMHLGSLNAMNREIPYQNGRHSPEGMDKVRNTTFTTLLVMNLLFMVCPKPYIETRYIVYPINSMANDNQTLALISY